MPVFSSGLEEKTTFAKDDMLLIGDSEANDTTRKIKVGTLLAGTGGGGTGSGEQSDWAEEDSTKESFIKNKPRVGKETISNKLYSLYNTSNIEQKVYSFDVLAYPLATGTVVYEDKDCTIPYGEVLSNTSSYITIDKDESIVWSLSNEIIDYVSPKILATEAGVCDAITTPVVRIDSATEISLTPKARTIIEQPIESLTITFGGTSTTIVEEYSLVFVASEGTQLIFANEIQWANETAPTFVDGKTYEINVIDNLALFISY